ncbi:Hint domain-containing protein [Ruegeria arenilitoris]|uniref:Hint domain-containing protein n=1 Tax=Ruegeria arenilitoris TaxID=1173585 RepID=UPI00147F626A|nr:Hint domain-containing protein [Ruegeria arenilitoris]
MPPVNSGLGGSEGYGENSFLASSLDAGNYDDGAIEVDITSVFSGGMNFFGTTYNSIFINTNGLITFDGPNLTYNGTDLSQLSEPAIAPFWTDIDISNNAGTGVNDIFWDIDPANGKVTITWYEVAAYSATGNNTFQVVLTELNNGTIGIEYIYENIEFSNGFGAQAQVGVTDGAGNDIIVPGSGNATDLLNLPYSDLDPNRPDGIFDLYVNDDDVVCFVEDTLITTKDGLKPVQWLRKGDQILTASGCFKPMIALLRSRFVACGDALPVKISKNILDNDQDLYVSPLHHVVFSHHICELLFGVSEVLVAAKDLIRMPGIEHISKPQLVSYYHLLMEEHEIVYSNGHPSESFFVGDVALLTLEITRNEMRNEISQHQLETTTARRRLRHFEAKVLVDALLKKSGTSAVEYQLVEYA